MGNVSFGILEHIDIPGIKYDPKIGILGLNVTVRLARPGFSVATRSKHKASVGKHHKITPDEAKAYLTKEFGASVELWQKIDHMAIEEPDIHLENKVFQAHQMKRGLEEVHDGVKDAVVT